MGRILIVDDNPSDRALCRKILAAAGHHVLEVGSAEDCLKVLEVARFEAILLDSQMPGMSGVQALPAVRKRTKAAVVACTGAAGPGDRSFVLGKGFDDLVCKPIRAETLLEVCARAIDRGAVFYDESRKAA